MAASVRSENRWFNKLTALIRQNKESVQTGSKSFWISDAGQPVFVQLQMEPARIFPQCAAKSEANPIQRDAFPCDHLRCYIISF